MAKQLRQLRPVRVVGIGLHRYQRASQTPYVALGLTAVREALADARLAWPVVEAAFVATATTMAGGRPMLRHLGASGIPITQIENASASGSSAFRLACLEVASGVSEVVVAMGVDKPQGGNRPGILLTGIGDLAAGRIAPFTHFALLADRYMNRYGLAPEQLAAVAVKNSRNGALNPYAQRRKQRTLEEVMSGPPISGDLTRLQCCPVGEGAAAVLVASEDAVDRFAIDPARAPLVLSSVLRSERLYPDATGFDAELTRETTLQALEAAQLQPNEIDLVELHDAFTVEELLYLEAMGICGPGKAALGLERGEFDIGGRCAVSASGGLLSMGHPIGPTGIGQIAELVRQLRGEAGPRQHSGARVGLAHMVGMGAVCAVHLLSRTHPD